MQKRSSRTKNEEEEGLRHGSRARGGHSSGESGRGTTHRWTAKGSSHEPGQDCTTTLDSLTPHSRSLAFAPATRGSMMVEFQRAWTMATRRPEPSCCCGVGPLREDMLGGGVGVIRVREGELSWGFRRRAVVEVVVAECW